MSARLMAGCFRQTADAPPAKARSVVDGHMTAAVLNICLLPAVSAVIAVFPTYDNDVQKNHAEFIDNCILLASPRFSQHV